MLGVCFDLQRLLRNTLAYRCVCVCVVPHGWQDRCALRVGADCASWCCLLPSTRSSAVLGAARQPMYFWVTVVAHDLGFLLL